jgi:hypothetical protein
MEDDDDRHSLLFPCRHGKKRRRGTSKSSTLAVVCMDFRLVLLILLIGRFCCICETTAERRLDSHLGTHRRPRRTPADYLVVSVSASQQLCARRLALSLWHSSITLSSLRALGWLQKITFTPRKSLSRPIPLQPITVGIISKGTSASRGGVACYVGWWGKVGGCAPPFLRVIRVTLAF